MPVGAAPPAGTVFTMDRPGRIILLLLLAVAPALRGLGDAIFLTRAMTATTIAEVFIEEGSVRVELEIGLPDLGAFLNIMPDELYGQLAKGQEPLADRLQRFFREDFVVRADGGEPIVGELQRVVPRGRVRRDEITGEPIPVIEADQEYVVFAELAYALEGKPEVLSFKPPTQGDTPFMRASVGFVVYHLGIAVNDFRYLGTEETLDLDWEDPWYSQFRNRNLWRQYRAPLHAFLYVDHFEVRKEIIARPRDLQQWVDLGLEGKEIIPAEDQAAIKEKVAAFLGELNPVLIDGKEIEPVLDRIHFVRRTLRTTGVVDPPEDLPILSATLGVIYTYPITGLPQEVSMKWELFSPRIQQVPTVATDEAGGLPYAVSPDDPVLVWRNFLKNPSVPGLVDLAPPPEPRHLAIPVLSAVCLLLVAGLAISALRGRPKRSWPVIAGGAVLIAVGIALWPYARFTAGKPMAGAAVTGSDAQVIVAGLLRNVYRAFDFREEGVIYDTLDRSAAGDLLTRIYLETRRALELKNQGGARAKVTDVEMLSAETTNLSEEVGFVTQCTWNVAGSVGHWGHIHQRRNRYEAVFTVKPIDGVWKITELELVSEERL
ncbi:MAG: hypothetical protein ACYTE6_03565 [Planctomycetota bacterium]|jgi:hypothetical protein